MDRCRRLRFLVAEWWTTFFDREYAESALIPATEAATVALAERVAALRLLLKLEPGQLLFDQCSGAGRMSHAFGRLSVRTIGVDLMPEYVEEARRRAATEALPCEFVCGDAFEFVAPTPCDAGLNWFTSFGYSESDERNIQMLERMRESLKPGARFVMDILNAPRLIAGFQSARWHRAEEGPTAGTILLEEPRIDWRVGVVRSTWTFIAPEGGRRSREVVTRLYLPHELAKLFERAGFTVIDLLGHPDGRPFERESPRLVLLAERR